jgi:predicted transcriptional regulator YheO
MTAEQQSVTDNWTGNEQASAQTEAETDHLFTAMKAVAAGIQLTFGPSCEVVLHDYRQPEHSAVAVVGKVTGRTVGSPMSEIGLGLRRRGDSAEDKLNYMIRLPGGRIVKSSTILLRTAAGHVVGALCINVDVTDVRRFAKLLTDFVADGEQADAPITTFGNDITQVIDAALDKVEVSLGHPLHRLNSAERLTVFRSLDEMGLFQLRRGVPLIAKRLGLSRASAYSYLARIREENQDSQE